MIVPLSESWKIAKSELVCVAMYYVQLVYIFKLIWPKVALKSGLPFDIDNSRFIVFNSLSSLLLECAL